MAYQEIPSAQTPGAGATSGQILASASDTTGDYLNTGLTTTAADITKTLVNTGADETVNLSFPATVRLGVPATWSMSLVRYFLIDYDGGNDSNVGYVDAAAGSTLTPAGLAVKTFSKLMTIIPVNGNGRLMVVLGKNRAAGAVYLDDDGVTESVVRWGALYGYRRIIRRGSSDLTNDATDRVKCGFITSITGPGGSGEWTCAGGGTTTVFSVSAGTFTVDATVGFRVRFTGNVTAGLANVVRNILVNSATQITLGSAATSAPAAGDTFFVEGPGFTVGQWLATDAAPMTGTGLASSSHDNVDVGIAVNSATLNSMQFSGGGSRQVAGIETLSTAAADQMVFAGLTELTVTSSYVDETGTTRALGMTGRCRGQFVVINIGIVSNFSAFAWVKTGATLGTRFFNIGSISTMVGCYYGSRFAISGIANFNMSGSSAAIPMRSIGGIQWTTCTNLTFSNCDVTGSSTDSCLRAVSQQGGCISINGCTGSTGNTGGAGFNVSTALGCTVNCGVTTPNTITGSSGDVLLGGGPAVSWSTLLLTNVSDFYGNKLIGQGGVIISACAAIVNKNGSALAAGDIVRSNGSTTQVVKAQGDTVANAKFIGVVVTDTADNLNGFITAADTAYVKFDGVPTVGAIAYLSTGTAGVATTTVPTLAGTNQKLRLGRVMSASGSTGRVALHVESLAVLADGLA